MKKFGSKGFSAIEGLLILVIIGIIGGAGWYIYQQSNKKEKETVGSTNTNDKQSAEPIPAVPDGWKRYENAKYGFSFNLPEDWKLNDNEHSKIDENATNHVFGVWFAPADSIHDFMAVEVLDLTLAGLQTNEWFKDTGIIDLNGARKDINLDGHAGYRYKAYGQDDNFYYFYEVNGRLIVFEDTFGGEYNENESQTIYESFRITQ